VLSVKKSGPTTGSLACPVVNMSSTVYSMLVLVQFVQLLNERCPVDQGTKTLLNTP
jgi:hypothetical protein